MQLAVALERAHLGRTVAEISASVLAAPPFLRRRVLRKKLDGVEDGLGCSLRLLVEVIMEAHDNKTKWETFVAIGMGVYFLFALFIIAIFVPYPTPFQLYVFRVLLALAGVGWGVSVPGLFLTFEATWKNVTVRAAGAAVFFVLIYFFNPPALVASGQ